VSKRSVAALLTAISVLCVAPLLAREQTRKTPGERYTTPRTPDGQPDLQGVWTMATFTPLERPANLKGKEFFTEEEATDLQKLLTADGVDPLARTALAADDEDAIRGRTRQSKENIHYDNAIWLTEKRSKGLSTRRTSLITDPPDGRIPPLTPEAAKREAERARTSAFLVENIAKQSFDSYETRTMQERCLVWRHEGPPMLPPSYNDRIQIFQSPGHVVIRQEMSNNAPRIVPLDGRPHLSGAIRQWPGDSIGHWEGDTLVVDTKNFTSKTHFQGASDALHVVERFTRVDADTIRYTFTVTDPASWTRPWSAEIPMTRADGLLYEYACHAGNHDLANILGIARNIEAAAAENAKKTSR
jgi:hypothetical protein